MCPLFECPLSNSVPYTWPWQSLCSLQVSTIFRELHNFEHHFSVPYTWPWQTLFVISVLYVVSVTIYMPVSLYKFHLQKGMSDRSCLLFHLTYALVFGPCPLKFIILMLRNELLAIFCNSRRTITIYLIVFPSCFQCWKRPFWGGLPWAKVHKKVSRL